MTLGNNFPKLEIHSDDEAAKTIGISGKTLRNYIRLLDLMDPLLALVDEGQIPVTAAFELAYLAQLDQKRVFELLPEGRNISVSQAKRLRKAAPLNSDVQVLKILGIVKEKKKVRLSFAPQLNIPEEDMKRLAIDPDFLNRAEKLIEALAREYLKKDNDC